MPFPVDKIRALCKLKNTSLAQLERELGIGNGVIARWENAKGCPPYDRLSAIAEKLGVTVEELADDKKENSPTPAPDIGFDDFTYAMQNECRELMNCVERVKSICKERKIPISRLERDLKFGNGYISQLRNGMLPADRLVKIARYLEVSEEFLLTGEDTPRKGCETMGTPERLVKIRESNGYTRKRLAEELGKPYATITKYETGEREPGHAYIIEIAKKFNVSADYILGISDDATAKVSLSLSKSESEHIKKYRALDDYGKNTVTAVLDCEKARCDEMFSQSAQEKVIELFPVSRYMQPASAGYGDFNDDDSYELIDLVKRPPVGTSFIISVDGDSMEPTFHNGDLLFVRAQQTIQVGEIGVFVKSGHVFVKEAGPSGLISHNAEYPTIHATEDEPIFTEGKILGVCTKDYFTL